MSVRQVVRVLLLDEGDRVLLVRFRDGARTWWCTPGGGVELGESDEQTAIRELREEIGLASIELGPCVWTRRLVITFRGRTFAQAERIYLARVQAFEPRLLDDAGLQEGMDAVRWWTVTELATTREDLKPRYLASRLRSLLGDGPSAEPIEVGD